MKNIKKILILIIFIFSLTSCKNKENEQNEHTHLFENIVVDSTCIAEGSITKKCNCGEIESVTTLSKKEHTYDNYVCSVCGEKYESSNLSFILSADETFYILNGIGTCTDTSIVIPSTYNGLPVKEIAQNAFRNNNKIQNMIIPDSVISVETNILAGCQALKSITMPMIYNGYIGYIFGAESSSYHASKLPSSLKEVIITKEEIVLEKAFSNASMIETIVFKENLITIEKNAFYNCHGLKELSIPNTLKEIKDNAFFNCENIDIVNYYGDVEAWCNIAFESLLSTPMYYSKKIYMLENNELIEPTELIIPSSVEVINKYQFYGFSNITRVCFYETVKEVGVYAFTNMEKLEEFSVDELSMYFCVMDKALYNKDLSVLISYPANKQDRTYEVNVKTKEIKPYAFYKAKNLEEINIMNVEIIGEYAFSNMYNLKKVHLTNNITKLENGVFYNCSKLVDIYLPDTLEYIGISVFEYCSSLESIFIPINVSTIKAYAFRNCSKLTIYCENSSAPKGWESSYWNVYPGCPVKWNQTR